MSTGRRLAKRSIIGTKVCAPGPDGLWYSGVIQDVKTPPTATTDATLLSPAERNNVVTCDAINDASVGVAACDPPNITADTKYIVRFDFKTQTMQASIDNNIQSLTSNYIGGVIGVTGAGVTTSPKSVIMEARRAANLHISPAQTLRRNAMIKEFRESDLIGPGFRSIMGIQLQPGQRVFLTHNGRETSGDVIGHDAEKDEVIVKITAIGNEEPIELKKRLEEVRLLESRRSARLADQDRDTDFARLADMGGDRRRTSHSIEVPLSLTPQHNTRKRPQPYTHECSDGQCNEEEMNECNAALILMKLSNSPKSPKNGDKWLGSSPGSSSASWSSGSSSPPLSDDGHVIHTTTVMLNDASANARIRTTSVSTSDEGIVVDFKEDAPRKKKANKSRFKCTWKGCHFIEHTPPKIERHIRNVHLGTKKSRRSADYDGSFSESDHEEEFYYTEVEDDDDESKAPSPTSPPTLSHRDMARPPHEDPEYQRQIVGNFKQGRVVNQQMTQQLQQLQHHQQQQQQQLHHNSSKSIHYGSTHIHSNQQQHHVLNNNNNNNNNSASFVPTSPLAHHNYTWPSATVVTSSTATATATSNAIHSTQQQQQHQHQQQQQPQQQQQQQPHSPASLIKHARSSPRPSQSAAPYPSPTYVHHHNHNYSSQSVNCNTSSASNSPVVQNTNNSSANNVLQQLSQQNITVTAHHSGGGNLSPHSHQQSLPQQQQQQQQPQHHHQQQHQLSAVTITPNYHPQQQQHSHQQSPTAVTASNIVATSIPHTPPTPSPPHTQQHMQQHHVAVQHAVAAARHTPNSPNRRTRGENKKCRKVYGMERRDQWCTQCRWKKACSRFGD